MIHFTNTLITIANKTISKTTISLKDKPRLTGVQKHKWMSSKHQEIQNKSLVYIGIK